MKFLFCILFINFVDKSISFIYRVKSLNNLQKSLRMLSKDELFLQNVHGDTHFLNYYYTTLYLGINKTPQVYILDTGSSITTSPCDKCISCGEHLNPKYKLENESKIISCNDAKCKIASNSRCMKNKCSFSVSYAEGSKLSGFYINQDVYFETMNLEKNISDKSYNIPLGCTTTETHLFKTQLADGIMGLNNNEHSFVGMLYKLGIIKKNIFSLCFEIDGGYFSIGEVYNEYHYSNEIKYTNLINKNSGNYNINFKYLKIGDSKVDFNGNAFIDSGTTITYFPMLKFNEIMKIILDKCKISKKCGNLRKIQPMGYCAKANNITEIEKIVNEGWGNMTIGFDGFEFSWIPKHYYFIYNTKEDGLNVCLGFNGDERTSILLGTTFMHGYDFIFDKDKNRLGMVRSDCNRAGYLDNIFEDTDIKNDIILNDKNIDMILTKTDNISKSTNIKKIKNDNNNYANINKNDSDKTNILMKESDITDEYIIKICLCITFIVLILFIIFNIILCHDNYIAIKNRKEDEDFDKYVLESSKYSTNGSISLFSNSV